jgi:hypothetical protein
MGSLFSHVEAIDLNEDHVTAARMVMGSSCTSGRTVVIAVMN